MSRKTLIWWSAAAAALGVMAIGPGSAGAAGGKRLAVAAAEPDIAAIAKVVGGDSVDTFSVFSGCIIRPELKVEQGVKDRLARADVIVWTGYLPESAAIMASLRSTGSESPRGVTAAHWIDVSTGAARVSVPASTCEGYVDMDFRQGNPFFWLNPKNAGVIARNIAAGLAVVEPAKAGVFEANAKRFSDEADERIAGWQKALAPLEHLVVFSTQCGWHNFAQIGGPTFVVCKNRPGQLPRPDVLVDYVKEQKVGLVIVDPHTPSEYALALRSGTKAKVIEVPSSIEGISGASSYFAVFDNLVKTLVESGT